MGGVKVSAPGRAVIVGDTLIKMLWEGFQEVTVCGVQTIPFTQTHTDVCVPVCVPACVCMSMFAHACQRGRDRQLLSPGTVVTWLFEIVQNRLFLFLWPLSPNCFFFQHIFAAPPVTTTILWNSKLYFHMTNCLWLSLLQFSIQAPTLLTELLTQKLPEWFFFFPNLKLFRQMQFIRRYN